MMSRSVVLLLVQLAVLHSHCDAFSTSFPTSALHHLLGTRRAAVTQVRGLRGTVCAENYVALTRELGKNGKLESVLKSKGIETVEIPCIEFEDGPDLNKLPAALKEEWEYVVVTSPEAADVFLKGWNSAGKPELRVASVGAGTQQVLSAGGIKPVFVPSKATGKVLAQELPGPEQGGRVLYPASAKARKEVQNGLTDRGFSCTRLNTYDTVSAKWTPEQQEQAQKAAVVALASPSAVKTWVDYIGTSAAAACIGETSGSACKEAGFQRVFWPEKPGIDGWAEAVADALQGAEVAK